MKTDTSPSFAFLFFFIMIVTACSPTGDFTGYSYDPEGVTITTDKEIQPQYKRTIGVEMGSIWVSNEFPGARMSDFYKVSDSLYRVVIDPENEEINNSPWYAFKIWSSKEQTIDLQLSYNHGNHRYIPKLSNDGKQWKKINSAKIRRDTTDGTATLTLDLSPNALWVSAQELYTTRNYQKWTDSLASKPWISRDTVGYSHEQHPIIKMHISETDTTQPRGVMILTGRLHPPEVTGALAAQNFINELASETELASKFRKHFEIWAYPFGNPDGVEKGHWRHNAKGIDLNRDWEHFNQPEPRAIRDDLLALSGDSLRKVYYGIDFHSTNENLFYPINRDVNTFPEDFTYGWIDALKEKFPDYPIEVEPFPTDSPIVKNWIYHTFGADAVTYEISDNARRDSMRTVTRESARIIMHQLLEEFENNQNL